MAILVHFGPFLGLGGVFFLAENFFLGTHLSFMTLLNGFFTLWSNPREKVENLQISSPPTIGGHLSSQSWRNAEFAVIS